MRWLLNSLIFGGALAGLASCQSAPSAYATPRQVTAVAQSPASTPLPDSLRLTPVPAVAGLPDTLRQAIAQLHRDLGPAAVELRPAVLEQACVGYLTLHPTGRIERAGLLAVADMDLPNTTERLWVVDLAQHKLQIWAPQAAQMGLRYVAHVVQADTKHDTITAAPRNPAACLFDLQLFDTVAGAEEWLRTCQVKSQATAQQPASH